MDYQTCTPPNTSEGFFRVFAHRHIWAPIVGLSAFLIIVSIYNVLLFHTLAEFFAIIVAALMFVTAWQTYVFSRNHFLMFLACGYFWIGMLDTVHALSYKGMNIFQVVSANPATQFWIGGRYGEALLLLAAPLFLTRAVNKNIAFIAFGITAIILYALIWSGNFPDAFIDGQGLTRFKINSEYVIISILFAALAHIVRKRTLMDHSMFALLTGSIVFTMAAELAFTYYISVYDTSIIVGHIFKIASYWLLFISIVRTTLIKPYAMLGMEIDERKQAELELSKSHDHLENILRIAPEAIVIAGNNQEIRQFNQAAERLFGYSVNEVLGQPLEKLIPPRFHEAHVKHVEGFARSVEEFKPMTERGEVSGLRKDGSEFPILASVSKSGLAEEQVFIVALRDITERNQIEDTLRQSEHRHQMAMNQADIAFWRWSFGEDRMTYWSDNYEKIAALQDGVPQDYDAMMEPVHPDDRGRVLQIYLDADKDHREFTLEYRVVEPDGQIRHIHEYADIEYDEQDTPVAHVGIVRDITKRKQAGMALEKSDTSLAKAQSRGNIGSMRWNIQTDSLISCSKEFAHILGVSMDEVHAHMAHEMEQIVHPDDRDLVGTTLRKFNKDGLGFEIEYRIVRPDGEVRDVVEIGEAVRSDEGGVEEQVSTVQDITVRKQAERTAIASKEEADLANRAKSEFLANMSHELRSPLNAILGFSQMIADETFGPHQNAKYPEYAKDIHVSGKHLLQLIGDILDISKIEAGEATIDETRIEISNAVNDCLMMVRARADVARIHLTADVPKPLPALRADERQLKQIIINLLSNAVKFTPDGGQVMLEVSLNDDSSIEMAITDTGIGIRTEDITKVLQPFSQVASSQTRRHEGTGLGLSICKSLMELHGGRLNIESELGEGTTVTITFPPDRTVST
ncbi:MAG: PAS domain S-box protein [Rhodospirillales bacterium]|nr:PAS domain S-box protein [Rhodospirillales bacterium]MBT4625337.1 PAS domain S-box protein [Rhodospirillales bacterium]MBT5353211.1 PAS domain S-box protein [Rhodospirillales bacterium]MBT6111101.1 PAS domain S-box protein [Rhodospirillales bacterium]MBT6826058.1 PAS domain S-box protein [Rhodospirillales bacterium]